MDGDHKPQHISRSELFTSLPARICYLQEFLEFTADDVEALVCGQRYIKTVIPAIVNMVYKKLLRHDITARVFSTRDSRVEEDPDEWVREEGPQIQNRKMFLRWYLTKLNSDPSKPEYWEYLDMVGAMHVGKARRKALFVDYIFLGACLGYIQDAFTEAILSHPKLELQRKIAIVKAIGKVVWIQNDLIAKWHVKGDADSEQQSLASIYEVHAEQLERVPEEAGESVCPFSGVGKSWNGSSMALRAQRVSMHPHENPDPDINQERPSGILKLMIVDGVVVGKEKLDLSILRGD